MKYIVKHLIENYCHIIGKHLKLLQMIYIEFYQFLFVDKDNFKFHCFMHLKHLIVERKCINNLLNLE